MPRRAASAAIDAAFVARSERFDPLGRGGSRMETRKSKWKRSGSDMVQGEMGMGTDFLAERFHTRERSAPRRTRLRPVAVT
jgi:hypothetical protein